MSEQPNSLRWNGSPGHYEVYYLSVTDPQSGVGFWIRYTMLAPLNPDTPASCSLWMMAMDPHADADEALFARKQTLPISSMNAQTQPFSITIGGCTLDDHGMKGAFEDVSFQLSWTPRLPAYEHVHPLLRRARIAKTVLELPHADVEVSGTISLAGRELTLKGARGGQAHLWGSKHASRWAWVHANDLRMGDGSHAADSFIDAVSVFVPRFGRTIGPSTPVVARFFGKDFICNSPLQVIRNRSQFGLTHWLLEAVEADHKLHVEVDALREHLLGVTYTDPDGELAYCYNTEVASLRASLWRRSADGREWSLLHELSAPRLAHFEYAQREPIDGVALLLN